MVSQDASIKSLGKWASKEFSGPITLGGVGNVQAIANHGAHKVRFSLFNVNVAVISGVSLDQITVEIPKSVKGSSRSWCQEWLHIKWKSP